MKFLELFKQFRSKFREIVAALPPAEQMDANSRAGWALSCMAGTSTELDNLFSTAETEMAADAEQAKKAGVAEAVAAKQVVLAADLETAVAAAKSAEREAVKQEYAAAAAQAAAADSKRAELKDKLPAATLAAIPVEALVGANAESSIAKVTERVKLLTDAGINAEAVPALFEQAATADDAAFKTSSEIAIAAHKSATAKPIGVNASKTPAIPASLAGVGAVKQASNDDLL